MDLNTHTYMSRASLALGVGSTSTRARTYSLPPPPLPTCYVHHISTPFRPFRRSVTAGYESRKLN